VDLGGIVNPAAIPFINSPLKIAWAKQQGAACYIDGEENPGAGAALLYESTIPFAAWTIYPREYQQRSSIRLWALHPTDGFTVRSKPSNATR